MRYAIVWLLLASLAQAAPQFEISFSSGARSSPADGRLILVVSRNMEGEPRFQYEWGVETQQAFGMDIEGLRPAETVLVSDAAVGFPLRSLHDLPPGTYNVQAVLHGYETFRRADGHVLKLPIDNGEGLRF